MTGKLYVVATPIGNLADITYRAVETLKMVDWIAAEDTRHSAKLLHHYDIQTAILSLHEHNELAQAEVLVSRCLQGQNIALISDAGTPLISDPGYRLVGHARSLGVPVITIPGPCAAIAALSISGLPTDRFYFEGFLPATESARETALMQLREEPRTLIFYESTHRILAMLNSVKKIMGDDRLLVLARELTKQYETIVSGRPSEVIEVVSASPDQQKGEFVVMISGCKEKQDDVAEIDRVLSILLPELSAKTAVKCAAAILNQSKNTVYDRALQLKEK